MKFHPDLEHLIPRNQLNHPVCPVCKQWLSHRESWNRSVFWLACENTDCDHNVTIFRKVYDEVYDDLEMNFQINNNLYPGGVWVKINYDCTKQKLTVFDYSVSGLVREPLFICDLPKWESFDLEYIVKKIKLYLVLS